LLRASHAPKIPQRLSAPQLKPLASALQTSTEMPKPVVPDALLVPLAAAATLKHLVAPQQI